MGLMLEGRVVAEEKRSVGAPSKYKPNYCQEVINHMADGSSITSFAAAIGVSRATINVWADAHPEFLDALGTAKAKCAAWWETCGRKIAMEGGGPGASTMVIFGLKNMGADDWRDKQELDHTSSDGSMKPTTIEFVSPQVADDESDD